MKNKPNLSGLLEAGKSAQEKLQGPSTAETSGNKTFKTSYYQTSGNSAFVPSHRGRIYLRETNEEVS